MLGLHVLLLLAAPVQLVLTSSSRLWIEGDSNVRAWSCYATTLDADAHARTSGGPGDASVQQAQVAVPVKDLRCGDSHMEEKLRDSLKSSRYPRIEYVLGSVEALAAGESGERRLKATGQLSIAGRVRPVTMVVRAGESPDGSLHATGSVPIQMSDYGVDPPSALLGFVQCKDRIVVRFDLHARTIALAN